jgi:rubrerythrin
VLRGRVRSPKRRDPVVHPQLTTLEAVALAVRSEIESTHLYGKLAGRVKNPEVKKVMEELAADEEQHRASLMALYEKMLDGEVPTIPDQDGREKKLGLSPEPEYLAVMTAARDKEISSEAFYRRAGEQVVDFKTRMLFLEVAESERRHAATLQKIVDRLKEDPHWLDRDKADPFKGMHAGP